jgi:CRP-like cAMP-binding protein
MNSFEILKKTVDTFELLNPEQWERFAGAFTEKKLAARELLQSQGEIYDSWYFISSGVLRFHRFINEKETTFNLFAENRFLTDSVSLFEQTPSAYTLSAVIDTTVLIATDKKLEEIYKTDSAFERLGRKQFEHYLKQFIFKMQSTMFDTPKLKYELMKIEMPELLEQIPQKYIASYLNITPQSLSRIKKQTQNENK